MMVNENSILNPNKTHLNTVDNIHSAEILKPIIKMFRPILAHIMPDRPSTKKILYVNHYKSPCIIEVLGGNGK